MAIPTGMSTFDLIVIGAGPSGMMAAITAGRLGARVVLLEAQKQCGMKVNASGGGRCNITNTQSSDYVMQRFGRNGRFMEPALRDFDGSAIIAFFASIGVECHAPDGFHVWPKTHKATTVSNALLAEMERVGVDIRCSCPVSDFIIEGETLLGVALENEKIFAKRCILATGGLGYPQIGGNDSGHQLAAASGHKVTDLHPAMQPLYCREIWPASCTAHTIPKVTFHVNIKKHKKLQATGALIFTDRGIAGPVVKDFAREVTPLLAKHETVPLLGNLVQGRHSEECLQALKKKQKDLVGGTCEEVFSVLIPAPIFAAACTANHCNAQSKYSELSGAKRDTLINWLIACPFTVVGSSGFRQAMVTRGGVSLKQIDPHTLASKQMSGLHFCGEAVDLDGPCGGFNLTWAWASGRLAGQQAVKSYLKPQH